VWRCRARRGRGRRHVNGPRGCNSGLPISFSAPRSGPLSVRVRFCAHPRRGRIGSSSRSGRSSTCFRVSDVWRRVASLPFRRPLPSRDYRCAATRDLLDVLTSQVSRHERRPGRPLSLTPYPRLVRSRCRVSARERAGNGQLLFEPRMPRPGRFSSSPPLEGPPWSPPAIGSRGTVACRRAAAALDETRLRPILEVSGEGARFPGTGRAQTGCTRGRIDHLTSIHARG